MIGLSGVFSKMGDVALVERFGGCGGGGYDQKTLCTGTKFSMNYLKSK